MKVLIVISSTQNFKVKLKNMIEKKKNPSKDLGKFSALFTNISLSLSIGLVLLAFEWKSYGDGDMVSLGEVKDDFEELMDIPITEQPPPPPPKFAVPDVAAHCVLPAFPPPPLPPDPTLPATEEPPCDPPPPPA